MLRKSIRDSLPSAVKGLEASRAPNRSSPSPFVRALKGTFPMIKRAALKLYNWVAVAIILGTLLGHISPIIDVKMHPLADGFITLIRRIPNNIL
jgi:hypothetical protein